MSTDHSTSGQSRPGSEAASASGSPVTVSGAESGLSHESSPPRRRASLGQPKRRYVTLGLAISSLVALILFVPPVYRLRTGPIVVTRYDRRLGETKATVGPGVDDWISTEIISRHLLHAIIAAEDGRFYEHHGLDFDQILKSYQVNRKRKRYARGASTISQQVVKMAFLGREKTLLRKSREALGALVMEAILPKDKILEWYINLVEFGDGVYGIRKGCWHYFKTKPQLLSIDQSVHLALVLPSPNAWSRGLRRRSLTPFGQKRFMVILTTMRSMGFITKAQWYDAVARGDFGRPIPGYGEELEGDIASGVDNSPSNLEDEEAVDDLEQIGRDAVKEPPTPQTTPQGPHPGSSTAVPSADPEGDEQ